MAALDWPSTPFESVAYRIRTTCDTRQYSMLDLDT